MDSCVLVAQSPSGSRKCFSLCSVVSFYGDPLITVCRVSVDHFSLLLQLRHQNATPIKYDLHAGVNIVT